MPFLTTAVAALRRETHGPGKRSVGFRNVIIAANFGMLMSVLVHVKSVAHPVTDVMADADSARDSDVRSHVAVRGALLCYAPSKLLT